MLKNQCYTQTLLNRFVYQSRKVHGLKWRRHLEDGYWNEFSTIRIFFNCDHANNCLRATRWELGQSDIKQLSIVIHPNNMDEFVKKLLEYRIIDKSPISYSGELSYKVSLPKLLPLRFNQVCPYCRNHSNVLYPKQHYDVVLYKCPRCSSK